jgi:hypothetical protein
MNEQDKEILKQGEPFIVGIVAVLIALRYGSINPNSNFNQAQSLYDEFARRFLD